MPCHDVSMASSRISDVNQATFTLGWLKKIPGESREVVGPVTLPDRPTTLGEARGGLEMVADDETTARWLQRWAASEGEERSLLLRLPDGWFELRDATIMVAPAPPLGGLAGGPAAREHYLVRFDRRSADQGPAA